MCRSALLPVSLFVSITAVLLGCGFPAPKPNTLPTTDTPTPTTAGQQAPAQPPPESPAERVAKARQAAETQKLLDEQAKAKQLAEAPYFPVLDFLTDLQTTKKSIPATKRQYMDKAYRLKILVTTFTDEGDAVCLIYLSREQLAKKQNLEFVLLRLPDDTKEQDVFTVAAKFKDYRPNDPIARFDFSLIKVIEKSKL